MTANLFLPFLFCKNTKNNYYFAFWDFFCKKRMMAEIPASSIPQLWVSP